MARTEREKMLAGELYNGWDAELTAARARARRLLRLYNDTLMEDEETRAKLLDQLIGKRGEGCYLEPPFHCDYGTFITLGERVYMNFQCVILDCNQITIGDDVSFGPNVHIYAATHPLDADERIKGPELAKPVTIGAKTWVGGGAIIVAGVTIGEGVTIGAGSVVTKDVPPYVLAAGNPCRVIRSLR